MARILLIISGGIAAYKSCEFIRLARKSGHEIIPVLTKGGSEFITPMSIAALAEHEVYTDLFSLKDETEMGHIRLSRDNDLIVIAPASANMIARLAQGRADDLASTLCVASNKPVLFAPAMNPQMWDNQEVQTNIKILGRNPNYTQIGPDNGDTACGELGLGRMVEPIDILNKAEEILGYSKNLKGLRAIVTAGPTHEPLDPVRFLGNHSSGKQGYAIATALHKAGADVTLISGPTSLPDPAHIKTTRVQSAKDMHQAVQDHLPADIFIGAAAVADWQLAKPLTQKHKKDNDTWTLNLTQTPDILKHVAQLPKSERPKVVVGFALESHDAINNARDKLNRKGADALLINAINETHNPFNASSNHLHWLDHAHIDDWGNASKDAHALRITNEISRLIKGDI